MTEDGGTTPPPGWYRDPAGPALRWWDGVRWTEHRRPFPPRGADPKISVGEERSIARWARHAVVAYAFLTAIGGALVFRMFTGFAEQFRELMENAQAATPPPPQDPFSGMSPTALTAYQLANMAQLALMVLLLIWLYRAATTAAHLGIPARRSPGWAVGSWFIPILNLWWPCQGLRDLLPHGHPMRRRVTLLWVAWIVGGLVAFAGLVAWMFDVEAGLYVGAVGYLTMASALLAGRSLIDAVLAKHEEMAAAG